MLGRMGKRVAVLAFLVLLMVIALPGFEPMQAQAAKAAKKKFMFSDGKAAKSTLYMGDSYTLKVEGYKKASSLKFYSKDTKYAKININSGKLKLLKPGKVIIYAKKNDKEVARQTFNVIYSRLTLNTGKKAPSTIFVGKTLTLGLKNKNLKFSSTNIKVATIHPNSGAMKAVSPGTVTIYGIQNGTRVATATFRVLQRAKSITPDKEEIYLGAAGDTAVVKATLAPKNSTDAIRFVSSDTDIATVGAASGKVTAKRAGTCTITIYAKELKTTSNSNSANKVAKVRIIVGSQKHANDKLILPWLEEAQYAVDQSDVKALDATIVSKMDYKDDITATEPDTGKSYSGLYGYIYQWYVMDQPDGVPKLIQGATKPTYTPDVSKAGVQYYFCRVSFVPGHYSYEGIKNPDHVMDQTTNVCKVEVAAA